eukprot:scaffold103146_cov18-Tisochrysis_lutea.AAC.2
MKSWSTASAWMVIDFYNLIQSEKARGAFSVCAQQLEAWEHTVELTLMCLEKGEVSSSMTEAFHEVMVSVLATTGRRGEEH